MNIQVLAVESEGILKLIVARPEHHTRRALAAMSSTQHCKVLTPHITLARLDELGADLSPFQLPQPPEEIEIEDKVYLVDSGEKQSTYVKVSKYSQGILALYLRKIEFIAERKLFDPGRIFHISLTNADHGNLRASVGRPWDFISHPI